MAGLGILSGSLSGSLIYLSLFLCSLASCTGIYWRLSSLPWALFVASLGILSGSSLYFFFSFSFLFLPSSSSFSASLASSLSLPFPSPSPSFSFLSRCLPKVGLPKVAAPLCRPSPKWPFVAMSGASRLVPAAGANYADACRGPPAQRLLAFSSLLQGACFLPSRPSLFLGTIYITCSYFSSSVALYETLRPLTYIVVSFPPFLLDDVGSVGSACGILSGPSSWTRHSL